MSRQSGRSLAVWITPSVAVCQKVFFKSTLLPSPPSLVSQVPCLSLESNSVAKYGSNLKLALTKHGA